MISRLSNFLWSAIAPWLAQPAVAEWLIQRAMRTPYSPIIKNGHLYMERFWLFNAYPDTGESGADRKWWQFPISIRIHHIVLPDQDRHLHDHPWNARTFILRGAYREAKEQDFSGMSGANPEYYVERQTGDTATLGFGEYHRIVALSSGGAWTMFVTGPHRGTWGFLVDGKKVQWRKYLGIPERPANSPETGKPAVEKDRPLRRHVLLAVIAIYCAAAVGACGLVYILGAP